MSSALAKKVIIVGIGGASCSGKTLLAKHIRRVLPQGATIIHQDDFCPPADQVPYSKDYPDLQDWDDPETCIMWAEFRSILQDIRTTGHHGDHSSHDHLNKEVKIDVQSEIFDRWRNAFDAITRQQTEQGIELVWYIVDGFVLYYDKTVVDNLDIQLFLRVPHDTLKSRREERQVYVLQQGDVWVDPPEYFPKIVWPGYLKAHRHIFEEVENGPLKKRWESLVVVKPGEGSEGMTIAFDLACHGIIEGLQNGAGTLIS